MTGPYTITPDDLSADDVLALLSLHLGLLQSYSPAEHVHAMPADRLRQPDVTFFAARHEGRLACVGAIRQIDAMRGELKSMRAAPDYRGRGAGRAMLEHLLAEARARGYRWVGLETGRTPEFADAHRLYERAGFTDCEGFDGYTVNAYSRCMGLDL